ncbi:MAG: hypothetical protein ACK40O_00690 [Allosphingosinicella sp.]
MTLETWASEEEAAEHRRERKRLSENQFNRAQSLAAWLLATLVAVNGGAVVAILSIQEAARDGGRLPTVAFTIGIVLAVLSGFCSWREAYHKSKLYYFESLRDDQLTSAAKKHKVRAGSRATLLGRFARYTNYGSLLGFVAGCVWAAWTYT